jgi:hypothetical protein
MSLSKSKKKSLSVPEQLKRKRDKEALRGQKINNDLRLIYGYGPPLCLLILVIVVIGLLVLHFCGFTLSVVVIGLVSAALTACAKLVAAIAKEVLNNN